MVIFSEALISSNYYPPVVEVEEGKLEGLNLDHSYCFLGIPYAKAGRFEKPQPADHWDGIREAQAYGPVCPITDPTSVSPNAYAWPRRYWVENEDCLNLNIWTPSLDPMAKKAVLVFFHGGGFTNGSSIEGTDYDGKNLSDYGDVVVVTVNHRLNVLGCLDLSAYGDEYDGSANLTLLDLTAALKWVHRNIEVFGGDPAHVAVFGQSGGSSKTASMFHMPEADGLYSAGFGLSYGAFWAHEKGKSASIAERMLEKLSLSPDQVSRLKVLPYDQLIKAGNEAAADIFGASNVMDYWVPTIDEKYLLSDMTEYGKKQPLVCGSVFSEFSGTLHRHIRKNGWSEEETNRRLTQAYGNGKDAVAAEFSRLFPDKHVQDVLFYNNRWYGFKIGEYAAQAPDTASRQSHSNIFHYLFSYEIPVDGGLTSFHGGELHFIFHNLDLPDIRISTGGTAAAHRLQDLFASSLVNLAKTGDPSPDGIEWKPWTIEGRETMIFDHETVCRPFNDKKLCDMMAGYGEVITNANTKVVI